MDNMLSLQLIEVKVSFEKSLGSSQLFHVGMSLCNLRERNSYFSLDLIRKETNRAMKISLYPSLYNCVLHTVYGQSCTHELLQYGCENQPIPLETIDPHWGELNILRYSETHNNINQSPEMIILNKFFDHCA